MRASRVAKIWMGLVLAAVMTVAVACGGGGEPQLGTVRLLTHDSFDVSPEVLEAFEQQSGITVELLAGGDAVSVVNQAILSAGNPVADVLFGIDNNQLAAAFDAGLFVAYTPAGIDRLDPALLEGTGGLVTPVDVGDVCVNYDRQWFDEAGLEPPESLQDLADERYAGLLVVQNPATSSPGLAFVAATVAAFGEVGWEGYWEQLVANDVEVADGWEQAYYGSFSGGSGEGDRPLVVSYATSPPAEVYFSDSYDDDVAAGTLPDEAPTGVVANTCYRQIEYAGILSGTRQLAAAEALVDFLISAELQADVPLTMFVEPARTDVELPEVFVRYSATPTTVWSLTPAEVAEGRDGWVTTWRRIVLG